MARELIVDKNTPKDSDVSKPDDIVKTASRELRESYGRASSQDQSFETRELNDSRSRIIAVIPAYNEDRFIASLILKTREYVDYVIVVDDGSSDKTAVLANLAGAEVLIHTQNRGKGAALETGFSRAHQQNAEIIVMLDGDGQHQPSEIPNIVQPILSGEADMVIGSRFLKVKSEIPVWRKVGQHTLTLVTNSASGVHTSDSQSGFRAFNARALECLNFQSIGFSVESEMQFIAREHNLRVAEAPISCLYVEKPKRNPIQQGLQVLNGIINLVSRSRPLFFFGLSGLLLTLIGTGWWGLIINIYSRTGVLAIGYALVATMFIIIGTLTTFQGVTLHALRRIVSHFSPSSSTPETVTFLSRDPHEDQKDTQDTSGNRRSL